jgi:hypothetical protein
MKVSYRHMDSRGTIVKEGDLASVVEDTDVINLFVAGSRVSAGTVLRVVYVGPENPFVLSREVIGLNAGRNSLWVLPDVLEVHK